MGTAATTDPCNAAQATQLRIDRPAGFLYGVIIAGKCRRRELPTFQPGANQVFREFVPPSPNRALRAAIPTAAGAGYPPNTRKGDSP
jgi:hypothetical protein